MQIIETFARATIKSHYFDMMAWFHLDQSYLCNSFRTNQKEDFDFSPNQDYIYLEINYLKEMCTS